jgi:hypothetical protein
MRPFTIVIVTIQYFVGIWMIFVRIWNNPQVLRWVEKKIQHRLNQFSDNDKCVNTEEPTICHKTVHSDASLLLI